MKIRYGLVAVVAAAMVGIGCRGAGGPTATEVAPGPVEPASQNVPVPAEILAGLPTCSLSVTLYPQAEGAADPGPGLRNVSLYVPDVRLEPPALWPDGTPISTDLTISEEMARALVEALASHGFFSRASRRHSEARPEPATAPPTDSTAGLPARLPEPNIEVTVRVQTNDWHLMRIGSWPLGNESRALLDELSRRAAGEARAALQQLASSF